MNLHLFVHRERVYEILKLKNALVKSA